RVRWWGSHFVVRGSSLSDHRLDSHISPVLQVSGPVDHRCSINERHMSYNDLSFPPPAYPFLKTHFDTVKEGSRVASDGEGMPFVFRVHMRVCICAYLS
ncbi:hypothetical protein CVT26_013748, partial [Gymnopilus dilepis]